MEPHKHIVIQMPYQKLACFHCGEVYEFGQKVLPAPFDIASAVLSAFQKRHQDCKPQPSGELTRQMLISEWDDWMEKHKDERKQWEKDTGKTWVRRAWIDDKLNT